MEIYLIRHGKTEGNLRGRYIGTTDESLCEKGRRELLQTADVWRLQEIPKVIVSPMRRCLQTAEILFPHHTYEICEDLRECAFGRFENKNYQELSDNPAYQRWIDSNGTLPFPDGEAPEAFRRRCCAAFAEEIRRLSDEEEVCAAFVVHGGTIMSILERYAAEEKSFYDWHVGNGEGYRLEVPRGFDGQKRCIQEIAAIRKQRRRSGT